MCERRRHGGHDRWAREAEEQLVAPDPKRPLHDWPDSTCGSEGTPEVGAYTDRARH